MGEGRMKFSQEMTKKQFYHISFYWGVFATFQSVAIVYLFVSFFIFQLSFKIISLILLIIGLIFIYEWGKILKLVNSKKEK